MIRRAVLAACLSIAVATPALAQRPLPTAPPTPEFLSRIDFHISFATLGIDDERFSWDTHVGSDFDLIDYVYGRVTLLADYQAVLGDELQPFDPNQGNYVLAVSSSVRAGSTELVFVFHHVSRHLGDRPKDFTIAMNVLVGRLMRQFGAGPTTIALRADAGRVVQNSYLDYSWTANAEITVRRQASPRVGLFGRFFGETYGVNPEPAGRHSQQGGRVEGGVRLMGRGGALELFAGYEKVVDADPIDRQSQRWTFAGFRIVGR